MKTIFALLGLVVCLSLSAQRQLTTQDYDLATSRLAGNTAALVDGPTEVQWLPDGRLYYKWLQPTGAKQVVLDPQTGKKIMANTKAELPVTKWPAKRNPRSLESVSPDGTKAVFIRNWNLWMRNIATGKETPLTRDGKEDFGYATDNAGWKHSDRPIVMWSPDSKKVATFQQDQRHVKDMYLVTTNVGSPSLEKWKYPLPGDSDVIRIQRVIIDVNEERPKTVRLNIPPDVRRGTQCDDIACSGNFDDNCWAADGKTLAFVSTSRDHKIMKMRMANVETGAVREVFEETTATQFESGQGAVSWTYLSGSNEIIWFSERSDWGHLYLYDANTGKLKNAITAGPYAVTRLAKVDEKKRLVYFEANAKEPGRHPYFSHLYVTDFGGQKTTLLTPEDGDHSIRFSPNGQFFTDTWSQPNLPPTTELRSVTGKLITTLEKTDLTRLQATGWQPPMPFSVKSDNKQWDLYGLLFMPSTMDKSKKYPVVVYIYPGPQGGSVRSFAFQTSRSDHQALAELGFVVVLIEGSCNPLRSKSFHDACYGNMATNTLPDQIAGLKQLAERHAFLDLDRVGIWGRSGGGYATAAAMFRYPNFFKVGFSGSGNHENRNYEDDWGERYIGLETRDANGVSNYEAQANQNYAKNLTGKLMLVTGAMDDNVPPYNTYLVVDALVKANKDFDLIVLPHARHGFGVDDNYIIRRRWDYFVQHLQNAIPPKEYKIVQTGDRRSKD